MDKLLRLHQFVDHCVEPPATERIFRIQRTVYPAVVPAPDASSFLLFGAGTEPPDTRNLAWIKISNELTPDLSHIQDYVIF